MNNNHALHLVGTSESKLKPKGYLARWEQINGVFRREEHVDPLLAFRLRERQVLEEK